ncbi:MAG: hypothetical protein E7813_15350 [Bradyrhizobium sp.]|uniref:hypothetical protein n=1 Tax=Bradyrhizobium sp. TaxID=376 RepID=UPI001213081B|nr:hypothetical protein [Bradyrhizobium sp.]THD65336.1 MAG: hypothetical protein E7813_15350 [Bradyrhizobium sp.]
MEKVKRRSAFIPATVRQRSGVTNGKRMFVDGSGKSAWARRWRDLKILYANDLDPNSLSEFQLGLIATAATLRCELERLEGQLSLGEKVDIDTYSKIAGHYRRIAESLGLQKNLRDVTPVPSVDQYLEHVAAQRETRQQEAAE